MGFAVLGPLVPVGHVGSSLGVTVGSSLGLDASGMAEASVGSELGVSVGDGPLHVGLMVAGSHILGVDDAGFWLGFLDGKGSGVELGWTLLVTIAGPVGFKVASELGLEVGRRGRQVGRSSHF